MKSFLKLEPTEKNPLQLKTTIIWQKIKETKKNILLQKKLQNTFVFLILPKNCPFYVFS